MDSGVRREALNMTLGPLASEVSIRQVANVFDLGMCDFFFIFFFTFEV